MINIISNAQYKHSPEKEREKKNTIVVIGIGGCGSNVIKYMCKQNIVGVDFWAINTDVDHLNSIEVSNKLAIGNKITGGKGSGNDPQKAQQAAEENREDIQNILQKYEMVYVVAGLGKGTGSGATPVIARFAKEIGILVIGVFIYTAPNEGPRQTENAEKALEELKKDEICDTTITIYNEKIEQLDLGLDESGKKGIEVASNAIIAISEIITSNYERNIDFNDVKTTLKSSGVATISIEEASGKDRINQIIQQSITSPLTDDMGFKGAKHILLSVAMKGGNSMKSKEYGDLKEKIKKETCLDSDLISGIRYDENIDEGTIRVSIIATKFQTTSLNKPLQKQNIKEKHIEKERINHKKNSFKKKELNLICTTKSIFNMSEEEVFLFRNTPIPDELLNDITSETIGNTSLDEENKKYYTGNNGIETNQD